MTLKELTKLIALCRKTGVASLKFEGIELQLGPVPNQYVRKTKDVQISLDPGAIPKPWEMDSATVPDIIKTDELSAEDMLFYSAGGSQ